MDITTGKLNRLERFIINHPVLAVALFIGALGLAIGIIEGAV